jgi:uncharacterized membrane protein YpjA
MKMSKVKLVALVLFADALLITLPFAAIELLTYYYQTQGMPVPKRWWFVPYSMGAGIFIFFTLAVFDVWQRMKVRFDRSKNRK